MMQRLARTKMYARGRLEEVRVKKEGVVFLHPILNYQSLFQKKILELNLTIFELRPHTSFPIRLIKQCPVCEYPVEIKDKEVILYCVNRQCRAKDRERIIHAVVAFDIQGIGPQIINKLLDHHIIQWAPDIFSLKKEDLLELEGFGDILASKLLYEINTKQHIRLSKFLVALGIKHVGEETALDLAHHFGSLEKICLADDKTFFEVEGIGEVVAKSLIDFFKSSESQKEIEAYQTNGVIIEQEPLIHTSSSFFDKTFVITGTLEQMNRDQAKALIRSLGGKIATSVSSKTDYLIVGKDPGSKLTQAKGLSVMILSEQAFVAMIKKSS